MFINRTVRLLSLAAAAFLLVATVLVPRFATADVAHQAPMEIDLDINHGMSASIENGALQLTFVSVQEDSRCPKDVQCFWQGQAIVWMQVIIDGQDQGEHQLRLLARGPNRDADVVTVGQYALLLENLSPYPVSTQPTPPEQYLATVHVKRS